MWNQYGFALAGDSNQSATAEEKTIWLDPVEKVFKVDGHQIAFAASGAGAIDGVEVNELVREWQRQLTGARPTLEEYVEDFLLWFYKQELPDRQILHTPEALLNFLYALRDEPGLSGIQNMTRAKIVRLWRDEIAPTSIHWKNLLGRKFSDFAEEGEITEREQLCIDFALRIQKKIYKSKSQNSRFDEIMESAIRNASELFPLVFNVIFDDESEWQNALLELFCLWIENTLPATTEEEWAKFLFIGYGSAEWSPKAVVFYVFNSNNRIPRVGIQAIYSPATTYYLSLGMTLATSQLIHGYSEPIYQEIEKMAQPHLKKGHKETFSGDLRSLDYGKIEETLKKVENLTVERLEFLARSMVQLESLRSYLDQPLPGVGGDIQVVTMTKSKSTVKVYPEFS